MKTTEIQLRLEKATHLITQIRFAESVLDELFFSKATLSVAPPPVEFFQNYTNDAYQKVRQAENAYQQRILNGTESEFDSHTGSISTTKARSTQPSDAPIEYPDNFGEILGQRIRDKRCAAGITQNQLAEKTGIKRPNIARLEKGQSLPNLSTLIKVSLALHIPLQKLLNY